MQDNTQSGPRTGVVLVAAALLGVLAGAGFLTLTGAFDQTPEERQALARDAACETSRARNAALDTFMVGEVAALIAPKAPLSALDLRFQNAKDQPASIADYAGKVVLLNLWATWCAPCREEMPDLDALQRDLGGDDFQVLTVNVDRGGMAKPIDFLTEIGVTNLPLAHDASMAIFNDLKAKGRALGMPVTMLIDREGCEIATMNGPAHWASDGAKRLIEAAIEVTREPK